MFVTTTPMGYVNFVGITQGLPPLIGCLNTLSSTYKFHK